MESFSNTKLQKLESRRNKPPRQPEHFQNIQNSKKKKKEPESLNIYAELSKKKYQQIMNDELEVCLPYGVKMANKSGSRCLFFECVDSDAKKTLIDGLEASGLSWQEN